MSPWTITTPQENPSVMKRGHDSPHTCLHPCVAQLTLESFPFFLWRCRFPPEPRTKKSACDSRSLSCAPGRYLARHRGSPSTRNQANHSPGISSLRVLSLALSIFRWISNKFSSLPRAVLNLEQIGKTVLDNASFRRKPEPPKLHTQPQARSEQFKNQSESAAP